MRHTTMAERSRGHQYQPRATGLDAPHARQAFHRPRSSMGVAGHFLHMGMVAAPFFIAEFIPDTDQKMKALRIVPVAGALASELLWTLKISQERKREEESRLALEACGERRR
jgi:hypothetical protein